MFLSDVGTSAAAPQILLFLVSELGTPMSVAGLFYLTNLAAPIAGYFVGNYSDRVGERLDLFRLCAGAGFLGWAGVALSTSAWMPYLMSTLLLAFSRAASSQIFAAVHDDLHRNSAHGGEGVVAVVRMALTAGWVIGPVAGAWLAAETSSRTLFWGTAICFLVQIVPLGTRRAHSVSRKVATDLSSGMYDRRGWRAMLPLLVFTGLWVLVYAGEPIKYGFLPIYLDEQLKPDPVIRGAIIGIQPLVEFVLMPFCVMLSRRIGILWLMSIAAALGFAGNLCFATWHSTAGIFAGQILMGAVWGVFGALGIIVAQRLLPQAVATASAIYMSSSALSSALGGVTGGVGVALVGLPNVFLFPALFAALAAIGLGAMARSEIFIRIR